VPKTFDAVALFLLSLRTPKRRDRGGLISKRFLALLVHCSNASDMRSQHRNAPTRPKAAKRVRWSRMTPLANAASGFAGRANLGFEDEVSKAAPWFSAPCAESNRKAQSGFDDMDDNVPF
jgi:hypothetical protein